MQISYEELVLTELFHLSWSTFVLCNSTINRRIRPQKALMESLWFFCIAFTSMLIAIAPCFLTKNKTNFPVYLQVISSQFKRSQRSMLALALHPIRWINQAQTRYPTKIPRNPILSPKFIHLDARHILPHALEHERSAVLCYVACSIKGGKEVLKHELT